MNATHPEYKLALQRNNLGAVAIVPGSGDDQIERTLNKFGVSFHFLPYRKKEPIDLDNLKVLILACDGRHFDPTSVERIRSWVEHGGFLLTTGWSRTALDQICPGYIEKDGGCLQFFTLHGIVSQLDLVHSLFEPTEGLVDVKVQDYDPVLLAGADKALLDAGSKSATCSLTKLVHVIAQEKVHVILHSNELSHSGHHHSGVMGVVFPIGQGQVFHYTSHLSYVFIGSHHTICTYRRYAHRVELPEIAAINFIIEGLEANSKIALK